MKDNELVPANIGEIKLSANGLEIQTVAQVFGFADLLSKANMLPRGTTVESAVVSIIAGARLGLDPFQAVQGIASINGRPALWGDALVAVVKASGLLEDEQIEYLPSMKECAGVRVTVKRKGVPTPYVGMFSASMARTAGLWGKTGPWTTAPAVMMKHRARAFAYRDAFADVLKGMRFAEEERDIDDGEKAPNAAQPRKRVRASASEVLDAVEAVPPAAIEPAPVEVVAEPAEEAAQPVESTPQASAEQLVEIIPIPE